MIQAPIKPLIDAFVMDHVEPSVFGRVRLFGILGSGLGSYVGGKILNFQNSDYSTDSSTTSNRLWIIYFWNLMSGFKLLFLAHAMLMVPAILGIQRLQLVGNGHSSPSLTEEHDTSTANNPTKDDDRPLRKELQNVSTYVFKDSRRILFFATIYVMGATGGVSDTFTYVRFREANCSTEMMGTTRMVSSIAGAIMFWWSGSLSERLGRENVLVLSLICAGFRFFVLRAMTSPYYGYLAETIRGGVFGLFWTSSVVCANGMAPSHLRSTMLLLLNGVYNGIGRSSGSLVGGRIQAAVGTEMLFQFMALLNVVLALVFFLCNYFVCENSSSKMRHEQNRHKTTRANCGKKIE
jgi:hypothetical protein